MSACLSMRVFLGRPGNNAGIIIRSTTHLFWDSISQWQVVYQLADLWGSSHFLCYHAGNFSMSSRDPTQALMFAKQPLDQLSWFFPALVASSLCLWWSLATAASLPLSISIGLKPPKPITAVGSGARWGLASPSCVGLVTFASHLRLLP